MCSMTYALIPDCRVEPPFVHGERCLRCRVALSCVPPAPAAVLQQDRHQHLRMQHRNGFSSMQPLDRVGTCYTFSRACRRLRGTSAGRPRLPGLHVPDLLSRH
jgi:hypothetical protein